MARPADAAIECTNFTGGGVRFSGFRSIMSREFMCILELYGKRAVFRLDMPGDHVLADCYDNIDPKPCTAVSDLDECTMLRRASTNYTRGAVVYAPYACACISSEMVNSILLDASTLDCKLEVNAMTHMVVHAGSASIVGGLQSQLHKSIRSRGVKQLRSIAFKASAPSRRLRVRSKQDSMWYTKWFGKAA